MKILSLALCKSAYSAIGIQFLADLLQNSFMTPSTSQVKVLSILHLRRNTFYLFVLIGRDGDKLCLLEDVGPEGGVGQLEDVVGPDQVEPGLVLVHRVEYGLEKDEEENVASIVVEWSLAELDCSC